MAVLSSMSHISIVCDGCGHHPWHDASQTPGSSHIACRHRRETAARVCGLAGMGAVRRAAKHTWTIFSCLSSSAESCV
jgi:hypothetical protein